MKLISVKSTDCTGCNTVGLCFIDLAIEIDKNMHTEQYQFNLNQAIEKWN